MNCLVNIIRHLSHQSGAKVLKPASSTLHFIKTTNSFRVNTLCNITTVRTRILVAFSTVHGHEFQAMLFAVFSKTFGITEELLPSDGKMKLFYRWFHLELWLLLGALLVTAGLGGAIYSVTFWGRHGFGALSPSYVMRLAIPSGLSLALGCQLVLSAFFLSLLRMSRRSENV